MDKIKILWADDEIDLLKPQIMFLQNKGYEVVTASNGHDAVDIYAEEGNVDVVFLDESMPGLTGLEALPRIKAISPHVPVVMITKNEAEHVMEDAIGSQISDYLIKPVNPNQILLTLKKIIDNKRLVSEKTALNYQQEFRQIFMQLSGGLSMNEWAEVYKKIVGWELRVDANQATGVSDILAQQKEQANTEFSKFVVKNYFDWVDKKQAESGPTMSHNLLRRQVLPHIGKGAPTVMLLLDNLRYDQWKVIEPIFNELFRTEQEDFFYSILPTATQYSRNAIFAGMMPNDIEATFPDKWKNDTDEGGKNLFEDFFLGKQIERIFRKGCKWEYFKVTNVNHGKELTDNILNYLHNDLTVIVYNFIDMLSHARTEMEVLKELAGDERAYRSLTRSWFLHSPLWAALQKLEGRDVQLFVTTDHGTIRVQTPSRVIGDRETTSNLRYKVGKNLQYEGRDVLAVREPKQAGLPRPNISSSFIFAKEDVFFLYPNNYNHYQNYYRNTFQHGGISLEEMICPVVRLRSK